MDVKPLFPRANQGLRSSLRESVVAVKSLSAWLGNAQLEIPKVSVVESGEVSAIWTVLQSDNPKADSVPVGTRQAGLA
jgi:hypothetical protein